MKKILLLILPLAIIAASVYITLSNSWIVPDINKWQSRMMGDNQYFPALTIFILAIPPLLLLALIKIILMRAVKNK